MARDDFLERDDGAQHRRRRALPVASPSIPTTGSASAGGRRTTRPRQRIGRQTVSLPLSPALEDRDVDDVIAAVREVLGR